MKQILEIYNNRWFRFIVVSVIYTLWFVVWRGTWWTILGILVIYDIYISKLYLRLFWAKHLETKKRLKSYNSVSGWVESIVFAVVVATLFRNYFLEFYVIPTSSMEKTLLVGDYLGVSKVSYGPKLPNTPLSIPFVHNVNPLNPKKRSYVDWIQTPYKRLAGFGEVKNGDVVVFNFPQGDTVFVDYPQMNYYQMERAYGSEALAEKYELRYHPVDKRDNYIKRCVAMHGDKLEIIDGDLFINGVAEKSIKNREYQYYVTMNSRITRKLIDELGVVEEDISVVGDVYSMPLTDAMAKKLSENSSVVSVKRMIAPAGEPEVDIFPNDTTNFKWNVDNFGPLTIPAQGVTVEIDSSNIALYERIIKNYEGNDLQIKEDGIYINSVKSDSYTFQMDYFFMMGDNRHNSLDSRYWGFVPMDHIVGKASFVWLSLDKYKSFPANIRFDKMFKSIKNEL